MARQLQPIPLVAPGFLGLNSSQASSIISPRFATRAENCIIDAAGRLAARAGYSDQTTTNITSDPRVETLFEFKKQDGSRSLITAWDGGIADSIADPEGNDISGAVTDADGIWWMQNFNNKVVAFQDGQKPIIYTGTGNFATVVESSGTAPTSKGGVGLCAYGRVWAVDSDGITIKYSDLLDETAWGSAGAGSIDMSSVWTAGTDEIIAIAAFNGALVVFGKNHIVFFIDGTGSVIGLDPTNIEVTDIIAGTGCLSQWSIQNIGESDLLFLSRNGVQSLQRLIIQKSNPLTNLTKNVRIRFMDEARAETANEIRSFYSPQEGFYGITFRTAGKTWILDQRFRFQDEAGDELSIVTNWSLSPNSWLIRDNDDLLLGNAGEVGLYGADDDDGSNFTWIYQSPWLPLGENLANRLKILKKIGAIVFAKNASTVTFKWAVDFDPAFESVDFVIPGTAGSEWAVGEWAIAEWGAGLGLRIIDINASDTGRYFRFSMETTIGGSFALQLLEIFAKIGRMA